MPNTCIEFKGSSFTLSVLYLKTLQLADVHADLTAKIAQAPDFFYLVPVVVNIEKIESAECSIPYQQIKTLIEKCNFTFVGFTGAVSKTERLSIREQGFSYINTANTSKAKAVASTENRTTEQQSATPSNTAVATPIKPQALYSDKVHRGQVRSGQQIYAQGQNLVIIGSVSAGSEIIADGNIHVYGTLRGRAIAGAKGHHQAQIYCQSLEAELVSINGNYWLSESMQENWGNAAYIHLADTELVSSKLN